MRAPRAYARTVDRACDPVGTAVDLERDCFEQPPCVAALGRPRRLNRVRRGRSRGRRGALERIVREPRRRLRRRSEAAEQPRGLDGRGRAETRAVYEHCVCRRARCHEEYAFEPPVATPGYVENLQGIQ